MSAPAGELLAQRRATAAFILARPYSVTLIPRSRMKTGSGTKLVDMPPRAVQTGRLIEVATTAGVAAGTPDGRQAKQTYQLLLPWNGQVAVGDYWVNAAGVRCEVVDVLPFNGYEVRAEVTRFGQAG